MKGFLWRTALALLSCGIAATTLAQDWAKQKVDASPRHHEWVDLKSGDKTLKTYVVYPEVKEKAKVVVLIHEIYGMTDWVQLTADELAAAGYIAVAPDFLSGMGPNGGRTDSFGDVGKVREAISGLTSTQVNRDLDAAVAYAKTIPAGNGEVSVAGFCWGGTQAFNYAATGADIEAAYVFYGGGPTTVDAIKNVKAPVYGFYASNDARVNATIEGSEAAMKEAGKTFLPVIYEGGGHGFMRAGADPEASDGNKSSRQEAWKRWLELLEK